MSAQAERRYRISEASDATGVAVHVLRQWEERFPQLKPARDHANRRYYTETDVEIVRRIKELVKHEKLTTKGARRKLSQEMFGVGRPKTKKEMLDLVDKMQDEIRTMLDMLDQERER